MFFKDDACTFDLDVASVSVSVAFSDFWNFNIDFYNHCKNAVSRLFDKTRGYTVIGSDNNKIKIVWQYYV